MDQTVTDRIEERVKSAFPAGAIERVQVLEYGDDREVEPGETAVRAFIARAGRPEGEEADKETVTAFEEANRPVLRKIRDELPRFIGWIEFLPDRPRGAPRPHSLSVLKIAGRGVRARTPGGGIRGTHPGNDPARPCRSGDRGHPDHRRHREQPRGGPALGRGPHPRAPGIRPAPGPSARDSTNSRPSSNKGQASSPTST